MDNPDRIRGEKTDFTEEQQRHQQRQGPQVLNQSHERPIVHQFRDRRQYHQIDDPEHDGRYGQQVGISRAEAEVSQRERKISLGRFDRHLVSQPDEVDRPKL